MPASDSPDMNADSKSRRLDPEASAADDPYFINSLARGLRVLSAIGPRRPEISQLEIAEIAEVSAPSALRLGHTLIKLGYLIRNDTTRGYRLGPGVLTLGMATLASMPIVEIAEPYLVGLRDQTGETVKMAVLQQSKMVYIARHQSETHYYPSSVQVGTRLSAHATSAGRAILSLLAEEEARAIVERDLHEPMTPRTVMGVTEIMEELRRTAKRGYALNNQSVTSEHRSVAAPIVSASGQPIAAVIISVSARRVSLAELKKSLAPPLREVARRISALLPPGMGPGS